MILMLLLCVRLMSVRWEVPVGAETLLHAVIQAPGLMLPGLCHLQPVVTKVALSVSSFPVSWKWEELEEAHMGDFYGSLMH